MKYRWQLQKEAPLLDPSEIRDLKISPLLGRCLLNRGMLRPDAIASFLRPKLKDLSDPFLLHDMDKAVDRLYRARSNAQGVVIFGDYDVDGITSTALLSQVLKDLGWNVRSYLPHRMDEGYGLSKEAVAKCLVQNPSSLLVAIDCGSTAVEAIDWVKRQGVDVIVIDHHQVSDPAPNADALVNPQLGGEDAPRFTELCSVGLAFKTAHALLKRGRELRVEGAEAYDLRPLLDFVALGTIADLVPLTRENRTLVHAGLKRLTTTKRAGLMSLKNVAGVEGPVDVFTAGFLLAPRLNAAGRMEDATEALHLLEEEEEQEALALALQLDARNRQRQEIERDIAEQVVQKVQRDFKPEEDFVIVEGHLKWHIGVIGIVASRVLKQFYRPTFVIGGEGREWRGSGRSVDGFDLAAALRECDDLLIRHGGHAMAAGISIHPDNIDAFRERLNRLAGQTLKPDQLEPPLRLDAEVAFSELTMDSLEELSLLEPFGVENPPIQLVSREVRMARRPVAIGRDKNHLKLWVTQGGEVFEALWWNAGDQPIPTGAFDLAFVPAINEFNNRKTIQLKWLDWKSSRASQPAGGAP